MELMSLNWKEKDYYFDIDDYLVFLGANHEMKHEIFNMINRLAEGGQYSLEEELWLGENGIEFMIGDKKVSSKNYKIISIESINDLIKIISLDKKSMFETILKEKFSSIDSICMLEELANKLVEIEILINEKIKNTLPNIELEFLPMTADILYRKHSKLNWIVNEENVPDYILDHKIVVENFCSCVKEFSLLTEEALLIQIKFPEVILDKEASNQLITTLVRLAKETKNIKLLIYHYNDCFDYGRSNLCSCVICYDSYQQLPDFDTFKNSIVRNYPCEFSLEDNELIKSIFRILPKVGNVINAKDFIMSQDMLLFKLVNELIELTIDLETSANKFNSMEHSYYFS